MICHCVTKFNDNLDFAEIAFFSQKKHSAPAAGCFFFAFLNAILNVVHLRGNAACSAPRPALPYRLSFPSCHPSPLSS